MKSSNQSFFLITSLSLLVSCASFNPFAGNSGPVSREIGPDGGSITSADGYVTLTFPAGALGQNEMITLEKIDPEILGPEFDEIRPNFTIDSAYELSPDGLKFDIPVHATMISNQKTETTDGTTELKAEILFSSSGGVLSVLENPGISRSSDTKVMVYGELRSFSKLARGQEIGSSITVINREEIEEAPNIERSLQSFVSLTPTIKTNNSNVVITQSYKDPLGFLNATAISQTPTTTGDYNQYTRTFNYTCFSNKQAFLRTNVNLNFSENAPVDILRNTNYNFENDQLVDCFFPENSKPEYNFNISDPNGELSSDIAGLYTLSIPFNIDREIADYFFFSVDWGDGNENTYEPSTMESSLGQSGLSEDWNFEDTQVFKASHQYASGNSYDIQIEGWAYDAPTGMEDNYVPATLSFNRRLANRWLKRGHFTYNDWEWEEPSSIKNIIDENSIPQISTFALGSDNTLNPKTIDGRLQIDVSAFSQFDDAYPLFSVDKVDLGENSWAYYLDYPLDISERYNISPSIRYNEFPQSNDSQPIQIDFNPEQTDPIIIQVNESNNPVFLNDFNLFDPNLPTRYIITPELSNNLKLYDIEETQAIIPENTLTIRTRGTGNGTIYGRVINNSLSSDLNTFDDFTGDWTTQSETDRKNLEDIFSIQNGDYFRCSDRCEILFPKNTEIEVFPRASEGSTFIGIENNSVTERNVAYKFRMTDDIDLTAFFDDPEKEDEEQSESTDKDLPDTYTDRVFQTRTSSGRNIFGSSFKVGGKIDWATRSSFEDAVCDQEGLVDCTTDGLTPVLVLFGETSLFDWNLTDQGIGTVPISFGASLSLSQVDFEQNYAYGTVSPMPYDINGNTGIVSLDTYLQARRAFKPVLSLPGRPAFTPYANLGMSNIWNCTDFEFMSDDENFEYHREHHGVHFIGGFGTDVNFNGPWGLRFNMDYTAGGADANLRFGAGVTFSPRSYRLGSRFRF